MDKKALLSVVVTTLVAILIVGVALGSKNRRTSALPDSTVPILYYGITCPHCKELDEEIATAEIDKRISITRKEVYKDPVNSAELERVGKSCNIGSTELYVPFLYSETRCIVGTDEIFDYLSQKATPESSNSAVSGSRQ